MTEETQELREIAADALRLCQDLLHTYPDEEEKIMLDMIEAGAFEPIGFGVMRLRILEAAKKFGFRVGDGTPADADGEVGAWWQGENGQGEIGPYPLGMSDGEIMQEIIEAGAGEDVEWIRRGSVSRPKD